MNSTLQAIKTRPGKIRRTLAAFATSLTVLCSVPAFSPKARAANQATCQIYDQDKVLKDYLQLPEKKRDKAAGEKLLTKLECIQKTMVLRPSHELFHALLKWVSIHEQNALGAMRLIRDVAVSNDLSGWMGGHVLTAPLMGDYALMGKLGMVLMYWKRSPSSTGIINAYMDIVKKYPHSDAFTGNLSPVGKEVQIAAAVDIVSWGNAKDVPAATETLIDGLKDKNREIRELAATHLFYAALNNVSYLKANVFEDYGLSMVSFGDAISTYGKAPDQDEERAIARTFFSRIMQRKVASAIYRNLDNDDLPKKYNFGLIRKAIKGVRLSEK